MIKDKIKELIRPVVSDAYNINLANSIYNAAICDVLKILNEVDTEESPHVTEHHRNNNSKEIAADIFESAKNKTIIVRYNGEFHRAVKINDLRSIIKKFNVEVEE